MAHPTRGKAVTAAPRGTMRSKGAVLFQTGHAGRCRRPGNRLNGPRAPVAQLDRALPSEAGDGVSEFPLKARFFRPFVTRRARKARSGHISTAPSCAIAQNPGILRFWGAEYASLLYWDFDMAGSLLRSFHSSCRTERRSKPEGMSIC
jgi:hypothetical protein